VYMSSGSGLTALLMRIVRAPSPFYRQRLTAAGLVDAGSLGPGVLGRLPLTRRDELVRDQLAHLPHGTRRCLDGAAPVRAGSTGTDAELLVLTWSAADLARERAAGARLLERIGVRAGMPVANGLRGALVTPGSLLLGDVIEEIGALDVPLGAIENEAAARQAWELFDRVCPAVLIVDHCAAARLFVAVPSAPRPWWQGIVWLQAGTVEAARPPVPDAAGFAGWQRTWLAVAEATSFVAYTCAAGLMHVDEGVVVEVVDGESGAAVPLGHEGVLALTPLGVDVPVLRYASGLRARAVAAPCSCGNTGAGIELL
jgi:phenylacetate-coenzyme A ligase PaaK-like adenylate-forming protein